ncbi:MAG: methylated-DNA--[protein]-cysteine S-methyltransferase [Gaiellaceae bacterium]
MPRCVTYAAVGWGEGELWLDGDVPVWHESPRGGAAEDRADHPLTERLVAFFRGEDVSFDDVPVSWEEETDLGRALGEALRRVPRGEVVSYGELAELAGRPRAPRAAGTFCARNRLPVFVPCHRVISANGIGGYGSLGVDYKRRLLALEGVSIA